MICIDCQPKTMADNNGFTRVCVCYRRYLITEHVLIKLAESILMPAQ